MNPPNRFVIYNTDVTVYLRGRAVGHYSRSCPIDRKDCSRHEQEAVNYWNHLYLTIPMPVHDYRDN